MLTSLTTVYLKMNADLDLSVRITDALHSLTHVLVLIALLDKSVMEVSVLVDVLLLDAYQDGLVMMDFVTRIKEINVSMILIVEISINVEIENAAMIPIEIPILNQDQDQDHLDQIIILLDLVINSLTVVLMVNALEDSASHYSAALTPNVEDMLHV